MLNRSFLAVLTVVVMGSWSCSGTALNNIPAGTEVTIATLDGSTVRGRLADVESGAVTVEQGDGATRRVRRADIRQVATEESADSRSVVGDLRSTEPEYEEVTVPAGTTLALESTLASDVSHVEDLVRAHLAQAVAINDQEVIPEGSIVQGSVTAAEPSGKVQGRVRLAFRFDRLDIDDRTYDIRTQTVRRQAAGTKTEDAKKIGNRSRGGCHRRRDHRGEEGGGRRLRRGWGRWDSDSSDDGRRRGPASPRYRESSRAG